MTATLVLRKNMNTEQIAAVVGMVKRSKRLKGAEYREGRYRIHLTATTSELDLMALTLALAMWGDVECGR